MYSKLLAEVASLKEEKELERKSQSEDFSFFAAGLSLVILPEQEIVDPEWLKMYPERGPQNGRGQRTKNISQAAAAAGEAILDRTRRAAAMRVERQRQKQLRGGDEDGSSAPAGELSRVVIPVAVTRPDVTSFNKQTSSAGKKRKMSEMPGAKTATASLTDKPITPTARRQQGGSSLSIHSLLSLAPGADELPSEAHPHPLAATKALMAKTYNLKSTQQRLKHPHPESMGGKRRASMNSSNKEPFLQAYLALTLPPLPATKERFERDPLPVHDNVASDRAKSAIQSVLQLFKTDSAGALTKIQLQRELSKLKAIADDTNKECSKRKSTTPEDIEFPPPPRPVSDEPSPESAIDPMLVFSVLESLKLIVNVNETPEKCELLPTFAPDKDFSIWSDELQAIGLKIEQDMSLVNMILSSDDNDKKQSPMEVETTTTDTLTVDTIAQNDSPLDAEGSTDSGFAENDTAKSQQTETNVASGSKRKFSEIDQASTSSETNEATAEKALDDSGMPSDQPPAPDNDEQQSQPAFAATAQVDASAESSEAKQAETESTDVVTKVPLPVLNQIDTTGMQFIEPEPPVALSSEQAELIKRGKIHESLVMTCETSLQTAAMEYLSSLALAVPIPKSIVLTPLKESMSSSSLKNASSSGSPLISRDVVLATVLVWLWLNHQGTFQDAFQKSGRLDVDPDCKWIIQAAVDAAVSALVREVSEQTTKGTGPFAEAFGAKKKAATPKQVSPSSTAPETENNTAETAKQVEVYTAMTVSRALVDSLTISQQLDWAVPHFQALTEYLDEARMCALRVKSQERTMLANLIARKATMNEAFSNAYTSAMIRAGEVIGQDKLFEAVQISELSISSMLPHDILTGEGDAWEDPCKPDNGYTDGLTGNDLMRRAHARAMIHKSMKKLQDRNNVRGGVPDYGPYVDPSVAATVPTVQVRFDGSMSPRVDSKKRRPSLSDLMVPSGTGSAQARTWSTYEPKHVCEALDWRPNLVENTPYGLHRRGEVVRSLSVSLSSRSGEPRNTKKTKRAMNALSPPFPSQVLDTPVKDDSSLPRSTQEINWAEVAGIFQKVELPKKSAPVQALQDDQPAVARSILAPSCRIVDTVAMEDGESDTEEDMTDETVLAKHQVVLDIMKEKIKQFLEKKKEQQQDRRRKNAAQKQSSR
jgi:hypothetical protein